MATMNDWVTVTSERKRLFEQERLIASVAEEIWEIMDRKGLAKSDLATTLSKSKAYISQVLSGSRNMTLRTLADMATALGAHVNVEIRQEETQGAWLPVRGAALVQLRPNVQLHYECQNDSVVTDATPEVRAA